MGWCSATGIFDTVISAVKAENLPEESVKKIAKILYDTLTASDWDCEYDSNYFKEYLVDIMIEDGVFDQDDINFYKHGIEYP